MTTVCREPKGATTPRAAMVPCREGMIDITASELIRASGARHPIVRFSDTVADDLDGTLFRIAPEGLAAADRYAVSDDTRSR